MSDFLNFAFDHSHSNIFGGHDYYDQNNSLVNSSHPNISGGYDYVDSHGTNIAHSHPNIFGGSDVNDHSGHTLYSTHPSPIGENVYDSNSQYIGHANDTFTGGQFTDLHGIQTSWQNNIFGGLNIDPLSNMHNVTFPPLV